jgi:hypothetical protein
MARLMKQAHSPGQKFFAELRAPMTERKRGLNPAAQRYLKKATSFFHFPSGLP